MSEGSPETREEAAARIAEATRRHERADKGLIALFPGTMSLAVEALKAPTLVNGGSAAAMLAFIGTGRQPITPDTILGLKLFAAGLLVAAAATGASWFSQFFYLAAADKAARVWTHPFVKLHPIYQQLGRSARVVVVALVLLAYGCAAGGMWSVASSLVPLSAVSPPASSPPAK